MELNVLKDVEKRKNLMMFVVNMVVPIAGLGFVMLFLHGTIRDSIVLLMALASVIVRLFEEKLGGIRKVFLCFDNAIFWCSYHSSGGRWKVWCHKPVLFLYFVDCHRIL